MAAALLYKLTMPLIAHTTSLKVTHNVIVTFVVSQDIYNLICWETITIDEQTISSINILHAFLSACT